MAKTRAEIETEDKNVKNKTYKTYSIILGMKYDAEIIGKLETVKNKSSYIKDLIKKDIAGELDNMKSITPDKAEELIMQYSNIIKEKYEEKYLNNSEKTITFQCSLSKCADMISKLDSVENKSEYVKNLILMDIGLIDTDGKRFMLSGMDGEQPRTKDRKSDEKRLEAQKEYDKKTGYAAQKKWNKENTKMLSIRLFNNSDADIIKKLETINNKANYIKNLIRNDIEKSG